MHRIVQLDLGSVTAQEGKTAGGRRAPKPLFPFEVAPAFHYRSVFDGREVEKIIAYYPPCPATGSWLNAHGFDPKWHLQQSGTEFRTRQYWYDLKTGRFLGRRCGCQWPYEEWRLDYPAPESVPKELFTFQVPAGAKMEVTDPELRRQLQSQGSRFLLGPGTGAAAAEPKPRVGNPGATPAEKPRGAVGKEAAKSPGERWVVMPVTTELQRLSAGRKARAYVLVDGEWFRRDRVTLDVGALNLDALRRQLQPYADAEKGAVHFHLRCIWGAPDFVAEGGELRRGPGWPSEIEKPDRVSAVLRYALIGLGQEAGFRQVTADYLFYRAGTEAARDWDLLAADLRQGLAADAGREEAGIGNDTFKVYPVRTALSRFLYFNADCVLHIPAGGGTGLDEDAIERHVARLKLKNKRLLYVLNSAGQGSSSFAVPTFYRQRLGFEQVFAFAPSPPKAAGTPDGR